MTLFPEGLPANIKVIVFGGMRGAGVKTQVLQARNYHERHGFAVEQINVGDYHNPGPLCDVCHDEKQARPFACTHCTDSPASLDDAVRVIKESGRYVASDHGAIILYGKNALTNLQINAASNDMTFYFQLADIDACKRRVLQALGLWPALCIDPRVVVDTADAKNELEIGRAYAQMFGVRNTTDPCGRLAANLRWI